MRWLAPLGGLGLVLAVAAAPHSGKAQSPVVVEFFTSQGCSACPPADAFFTELAGRPGVIALALHVDYWDYLGWRDVFGRPENTERQRAYAKAHKERTIYTPQMIVHGADLLFGNEKGPVRERIAAHEAQSHRVRLDLRRNSGNLEITVEPESGAVGEADVHVVEYAPEKTMTVEGGENAGYHHTFKNVVTSWATVGRWDGASALTLRHDGGGGGHVAVLVQRVGYGPILSAASLP
jgi:hypothetical protein